CPHGSALRTGHAAFPPPDGPCDAAALMHPGGVMRIKPNLTARHLSRAFGSGLSATVPLRDVSLDLREGEVTLLMGPSGSGKTTLLAVLSGLLPPDGGQVLALGHDVWRLSEARREEFRLRQCGFIFQGCNLFPALTAWQQLEMV